MDKRRFIWNTRLSYKLIAGLAISFLISAGFYVAANSAGDYYITHYLDTEEKTDEKADDLMEKFQRYITKQQLTIYDIDKIYQWINEQGEIDIYCSGEKSMIEDMYQEEQQYANSFITGTIFDYGLTSYEINFSDQTVYCYPILYDDDRYYKLKSGIVLSLAFICFLGSFLLVIRKRILYISKLAKDMKVLESGELEYPICLPGNDELAYLAKSIDDMRLSVIEKMENEKKAIAANSQLITAMSHDLRTPLTKQIGYLDIIKYEKYDSEEEKELYIIKAREKAYQIKKLSDQLFRYFLAFDSEHEEGVIEVMEGNSTINQMLHEQIYFLESQKFKIKANYFEEDFEIDANGEELYRVFDNMFSNINKYGDKSKEVEVEVDCMIEDNFAVVLIYNRIPSLKSNAESTKIGLKISEKLVSKINGYLDIKKNKKEFQVEIGIPVKNYST